MAVPLVVLLALLAVVVVMVGLGALLFGLVFAAGRSGRRAQSRQAHAGVHSPAH